jgi:4-hydroxybenzoate polyprenyltransferase
MTVESVASPTRGAIADAPRSTRARVEPRLVLEAMRPGQWSKNAFVLAGLVFAGEVLDPGSLLRAAATFVAFCLASGAAYLINDVRDAEVDRQSPRTAGRPIARGDLSPRIATIAAVVSMVAAAELAAAVNWATLAILAGFLSLQFAYTHLLKHILFVDVMTVAGGFVMRALAGGVAINVPVSEWLLLCTGVLALFLGFTKRRGELVALGDGAPGRVVLRHYSLPLLDELIAVVTPTAVVVYAIYAVLGADTDAMLLTVPFVLYGIFRVLYITHHRPQTTEDPSEVVLHDTPLLVCVALWGASAALIELLA